MECSLSSLKTRLPWDFTNYPWNFPPFQKGGATSQRKHLVTKKKGKLITCVYNQVLLQLCLLFVLNLLRGASNNGKLYTEGICILFWKGINFVKTFHPQNAQQHETETNYNKAFKTSTTNLKIKLDKLWQLKRRWLQAALHFCFKAQFTPRSGLSYYLS